MAFMICTGFALGLGTAETRQHQRPGAAGSRRAFLGLGQSLGSCEGLQLGLSCLCTRQVPRLCAGCMEAPAGQAGGVGWGQLLSPWKMLSLKLGSNGEGVLEVRVAKWWDLGSGEGIKFGQL